jgi:L-ribulokinase
MHRLKAISREARGGSSAPVAEPEAPAAASEVTA